ncbi:MAG TPA: ABC transporter substrate-binding protein [Hyphomicrobiaceae bacterium]|nr:ABC transporter substrate-binding protein [Hyphomicrobiaceae bacterium]
MIRHAARFALTALAVGLGAVAAHAQTKIKFALDWRFEGPAAPYFVAIDKGFYKAEGLDVTIDAGNGSVEAINRVATGAYEIAFGDINSLVKFRDSKDNAPVKAVMMVYDQPAFSIVTLKKSGITKPKDLEGKTLGAPAPDGAYAQWPIFTKANGIDASKVKIENVGFPVREPMLAQGKVDAITGFWFSSYMNLKANGVAGDDIVVLHMRDHGVELYGNAIIVNPKFAAENPKAVAGFIRATIKGIQETIKSPETAIKSLLTRNQIAKEDVELERLKLAISKNFVTKETDANGIGAVDMARLTKSIDQIGLTFDFKNKPSAADVFDPQFLPPKDQRMTK